MLPEEIGHVEVKDHGNNPADAQMPIVGERSTGNVINLQIQHTGGDVHVSINQDQLGVEVCNCIETLQVIIIAIFATS